MASLQDQLLKAGLVDKNTAKKVSKDKHKATRTARKSTGKSAGKSNAASEPEVNAMKALNAERDRALNREKQAAAEEKAIGAQIRQLIEMNRVDRSGGEIGYNFIHEKKVKTIYITEDIQKRIGTGRLVIVHLHFAKQSRYEVVPKPVADKIAERDAACVIQNTSQDNAVDDEDDTYAAFEVPDDLMW